MIKRLLILFLITSNYVLFAQTEVSGLVFDEYLEPFPGAVITINKLKVATSDFDGAFEIKVEKFPVTMTVSAVGYQAEKIILESASQDINVILKESQILDQVVLSASRTPERVMESPVTIERIDQKYIGKTPSPNFYQSLGNLKGIDILDNNLITKAIASNRGFVSTDNVRTVQLVDGVDVAVPVFDYALGNTFGLNELDVKNVEILPGAASALYGANALNNIVLMTSRSPFDDTGISMYTKSGVTTQESRGTYGYYDVGARFAYKFNDWIAGKVNMTYFEGEDWHANDISDVNGTLSTDHSTSTSYDGVNVYGDEVGINLVDLALLAAPDFAAFGINTLGLISTIPNAQNQRITRTGYRERDIFDYGLKNTLFDAALHFRPWGENEAEIILATKFNTGNNISQASNRYLQSGSYMEQYKIEVKGKNYFVRGYYNENNAGRTLDSRLAGIFVINDWKSHGDYFGEYAQTYFGALAAGIPNPDAHAAARNAVNTGLPVPGSAEYQSRLNLAGQTNLSEGGARLFENSGYYHADANLNLADYIDFADIQVGGSFRSYALDSQGQVYTDDDGVIRYRQFGVYTQLQKKFLDDRLKFTGTLRYDKSRNFDGNFSPRATLSYAVGEKRDHNFRVGFQTGFRNPTSQDQYIGINLGNAVLVGSVEENLTRETVTRNFTAGGVAQSVTLSGVDAFENAYTSESVAAFQNNFRTNAVTGNIDPSTGLPVFTPSLLQKSTAKLVQPEIVRSFEVGYRGATSIGSKLLEFDIVGFYNFHEDFITPIDVEVPLFGDVDDLSSGVVNAIASGNTQTFSITTNSESTIEAYGFTAGFNTKILGDFDLGASYAYSDFSIENNDAFTFKPFFNTPKHSVKAQFGHERLFKNFGFNTNLRWQDTFLYQTRFANTILDARFVLDAQLNYAIPSIKSVFKVGGTNLTGKEYNSVPEAGTIGSQYYISWTINN